MSPIFCREIRSAVRFYHLILSRQNLREDEPEFFAPASVPRNELALQAGFYAGEFGTVWRTECGREVRLLDPGEWNREAGPDFLGATVLFDGSTRARGDIELDIYASGWEAHGHATNPDFENVVLHVFFKGGSKRTFARTLSHREVPQVCIGPEVSPSMGSFSLNPQPIDSPAIALRLLEVAARFRLASKAARLAAAISLHGKKVALWQALAGALGYKSNTVPMTLLAQRCGLRRAAAPGGEALLFGLAGFLDQENLDQAEDVSRKYLRALWQTWWKVRDGERRLILPPSAWKTGGVRPANHPHRRVAALHAAASAADLLLRALDAGDMHQFEKHLSGLSSDFWERHWNLRGTALPRPVALVGDSRVADIHVNIVLPWLAAHGRDPFPSLFALKMPMVPRKVQMLADWLCPALSPADLARAGVQQGLLQLGADFRGCASPAEIAARHLSC
jgi:hypothetical protein